LSQKAAGYHAQKEETMRPNLTDVLNAVASLFVAASLSLVRYYLQGKHSVIGCIDTEGVKKKSAKIWHNRLMLSASCRPAVVL
jgi:hypothetical protein